MILPIKKRTLITRRIIKNGAQESLKKKLVLEDDFAWGVPSQGLASGDGSTREKLKYIGGVDISFLKKDPSVSCGALVVLDADTMDVVHEEFEVTRLQVPYVPGFLAFREAPMLLGLLNKMKANAHPFYPQLLMVDGNGLLHPRGLGLACHLGILAHLPTIGIGKNLHHVDGLTQSAVRQSLEARENYDKDLIFLTGKSGKTWGVAMRSILGSSKPIYVSIGHRISLDSAISIVKTCCKYRIPEPIRQVISWTPSPSIYQRHQEDMKTYLRFERTLSNMKA
uniref:Endonuclease V family protein n=1 Tax=Musa acuminata subsp. malaccensis TaxID=214687 RepID=A0A804KTM6_MUSAM|nr:PREDICTED: endonuclease V isoform X3 [Musa acuminata subsp. malaccensis]